MSAPNLRDLLWSSRINSVSAAMAIDKGQKWEGGTKSNSSIMTNSCIWTENAIKRKPYQITKIREKWRDDEHERFLEALELYGRCWAQITEHVGTKTIVQIRSHAQKFFAKLSAARKESMPPPRPKSKLNHPYSRDPNHFPAKKFKTLSSSSCHGSHQSASCVKLFGTTISVSSCADQNMMGSEMILLNLLV